ncbi:MAG: helix-turn-helix transcriptional regulator [Clostridia bacterium]|nr:helix-turn-helix transcriptional regulator [Clostridia bacterium]
MITNLQIQRNIASAIKQSGLTQTEIAKRLNVKQPTIGQYLSGRAMPSLETFANLCVVLDLEPADILGINDIAK